MHAPHDDDQLILIDHAENVEDTAPEVAPGTRGQSAIGLLGAAVIIVALGWLVITGGNNEDAALPPTTTSTPTTTAPAPDQRAVVGVASVNGVLRDGRTFEVYESSPGVLCVTLADEPADAADICHLELESASGAGVIENLLVFGYLPTGAESASVRYRSGQSINDGIRIEPSARFFAVPLQFDDAYRLQYRDSDVQIQSEVPLVALRGGASQSPEAALRDAVPPEIAALSFNQRVVVAAEWTDFREGPMVWSTQPTQLTSQPGWGELLRLDATGTRIERATPIPSIRLTAQLFRPDAIYFLGEQVTTPNQLAVDRDELHYPVALVRIDRDTGEALIRLFPQASTNDEPDINPDTSRPGWEIGPELADIDLTTMGGIDGDVRLRATDGASIQLDGATLQPSG